MGDSIAFYIMIGLSVGIIFIIKAMINNATNTPTWQGVIISAIFCVLPLYLIMCWLGWMGEKRIKRR